MKTKLKILLLSSFSINLSAGLFDPLYAVFVEGIGGDLLIAGSAYATFSIACGILIFFLSKWEDKIKHKENLLIIGRTLTFIGTVAYIFINAPYQLFLVQIIFGISEAIGNPAFDAMFSKNLSKGKYASQWGKWESLTYIAIGISGAAGGIIAQILGFRILLIMISAIAFASLIITLLLRKQIRELILKKPGKP